MAYEHYWALLGIIAVASYGAGQLYRMRVRNDRVARRRELIHEERMAALDRGIPFHDMPPDLIDEIPELVPILERQYEWLERAALGVGLVLTTGGIGWIVAYALVPVTKQTLGMRELAPIGVIPMMVGIGLLLFRHLIRRETGSR